MLICSLSTIIMDYFKQTSLLLLSPKCYEENLKKYNILDVQCFKATFSRCLGYGIIVGSSLVKVPQILKLYKNKSGEGISVSSVTLDLTAINVYISYSFMNGFPFTAWGDKVFLAIQNVIIASQVLHYSGDTLFALSYLVGYVIITSILTSGVVPIKVLWTLQGLNIPILVAGKLIQAFENYKNGHTGQLSAATTFLLFAGTLSRIFTSIQETGDLMTIVTFIAASLGNSIIVMQLLYYWNVSNKKKTE